MICKNCGQDNPPQASFCLKCGLPLAQTTTFALGVGSSYGNGWRKLWKNFGELLLSGIIAFVLTVPAVIILGLIFSFGIQDTFRNSAGLFPGALNDSFPWGFQILLYVFNIVYYTPVLYGLLFVYMTAARGDRVKIGDIFASFKNYGNVILVGIFYMVVSNGISLLLNLISRDLPLLGIPLTILWAIFSIILYCKLAFIPYLLLDRKMKAIDSIRTSWNMTNGHGWKVFLIGLLAIPIFIAGFICFFVGVIISVMWVSMALGSLYHAVSTSGAAPKPLESTAPPPAT